MTYGTTKWGLCFAHWHVYPTALRSTRAWYSSILGAQGSVLPGQAMKQTYCLKYRGLHFNSGKSHPGPPVLETGVPPSPSNTPLCYMFVASSHSSLASDLRSWSIKHETKRGNEYKHKKHPCNNLAGVVNMTSNSTSSYQSEPQASSRMACRAAILFFLSSSCFFSSSDPKFVNCFNPIPWAISLWAVLADVFGLGLGGSRSAPRHKSNFKQSVRYFFLKKYRTTKRGEQVERKYHKIQDITSTVYFCQ